MSARPRIGLVLGGCGLRGFAHIGVLQVLEREGIRIDLLMGTSSGALAAAAYAAGADAVAMEKRFLRVFSGRNAAISKLKAFALLRKRGGKAPALRERLERMAWKHLLLLRLLITKRELLSPQEMEAILAPLVPDIPINETVIPFATTATDLVSGQLVVIDRGSLRRAVMASCAVPGLTSPVQWEGKLLADGGIVDTLPVAAARQLGADVVIAVDVAGPEWHLPPGNSLGAIIDRSVEIMCARLRAPSKERADILIEPALDRTTWTEAADHAGLIRLGQHAAVANLPRLRALVPARRRHRIVRRPPHLAVSPASQPRAENGQRVDWGWEIDAAKNVGP